MRKVIDALGRATEYQYYAADEANLARRGQVKRVIVPGGYWRELDYGGLGWVVRREVQTASGSEVTTYTYDAWGRLRGIDYPRSADVSMGWDGENRRVWVVDGAGRREYTYDAWGRVVRQQGCCGSESGIEVQVVTAEYDAAGRKRFEKERRLGGSLVRTIEYTYDALGRLESVGDCMEEDCNDQNYQRKVVYSYEPGTGRLQREKYPNGSFVEYTYYGAGNPPQVGHVWKVEHKRTESGNLLIGYEYEYDLLGRVVQSVERPSGDTTVYTYTPAGRLASEVRTGQVAYSRSYDYNPDGSRAMVMRDDMVNGTHWDLYSYDEASGRLASVLDVWSGEENNFVWNPEGTLARWSTNQPNSYARVFGYDEEGRLTRIERDYGNGNLQVAYEYGYNSDGVRVWKRDGLAGQEYRYVCRIGCGGMPMRVYNRTIGSERWASVEDYLPVGNALGYNGNWRFAHSGGTLLMMTQAGEPWGYYPQDSNGLAVQSEVPAACVCVVYWQSLCAPIVDGGCGRSCEETPPVLPPDRNGLSSRSIPNLPRDPVIYHGSGGWNIIGCMPSQIAEIRKHLDDLCLHRVGGNTPMRRCLQRMCQSGALIRCLSEGECRAFCGNCCAFTSLGGVIGLCPAAFNNPKGCGCLGSTIAHEMAHQCGADEPGARRCEWYLYRSPEAPLCPK